jgi:hypothetical protein
MNALSTAVPRELARINYLSSPGPADERDMSVARAAKQDEFFI